MTSAAMGTNFGEIGFAFRISGASLVGMVLAVLTNGRRGRGPLGYLGDRKKTEETFPIIDGERIAAYSDGHQRPGRQNGTGGPITGVCSGAAAPIRITTALPPGFMNGSTSIFQLFVTHRLPDGSTAPAVIRVSASLR